MNRSNINSHLAEISWLQVDQSGSVNIFVLERWCHVIEIDMMQPIFNIFWIPLRNRLLFEIVRSEGYLINQSANMSQRSGNDGGCTGWISDCTKLLQCRPEIARCLKSIYWLLARLHKMLSYIPRHQLLKPRGSEPKKSRSINVGFAKWPNKFRKIILFQPSLNIIWCPVRCLLWIKWLRLKESIESV